LIDSHVHLNRREFDGQAAQVVDRASQAGVTGFLNVGYDLDSSRESITLAEGDSRILATVGIHPHDALMLADEHGKLTTDGERALEELAADHRRRTGPRGTGRDGCPPQGGRHRGNRSGLLP